MTRSTKLMTLCAFVFGLSFASAAFARDCVTECKRAAIAQCLLLAAEGEAEACYTADYSYCRVACGVVLPNG
ncbi:hypothetical protein IEQ11_24665 [Lysobacter capsici]|jgi:hypothetical protein|uniref:hypothetical protein n=1 Tax=Lysobacter capsici TaxID=435897 RepID=UPI000BBAEFF2|nr:hypothetical protein [Lysobacter capsici]ATE74199.1 hypothetical protein CNO08_24270 [Lysobacter capsici]UOF14864.1 hypothetical protein IEQ11_24665 [Lysobacter capsici]